MTVPVYDTIGSGYNATRAADPYITDRIVAHLVPSPHGRYLDIGCGTGNYLAALTRRGLHCIGVDPSATMVATARAQCSGAAIVQAAAERLPLADACADGALAMLTMHHWTDDAAGLAEIARVLRRDARLVLFTFTPEQLQHYWLNEYFPNMLARAAAGVPEVPALCALLEQSGFASVTTEPYIVRDDLQDHFLYSHKHRPAQYLRPEVRAGSSGFRLLASAEELVSGLARLEADLASGRIDRVVADHDDVGDYIFVIATAGA